MINRFELYLVICESGEVEFSEKNYQTMTIANSNMEDFISTWAKKQSFAPKYISKDDMDNLRRNKKEKTLYIRREPNGAVLYRHTAAGGWVRTNYSLVKIGHVRIRELLIPHSIFTTNIPQPPPPPPMKLPIIKEKTSKMIIPINSDPAPKPVIHVPFMNDLKSALKKRRKRPRRNFRINKKTIVDMLQKQVVKSLVDRKLTLNHVDPPKPRKWWIEDTTNDESSEKTCK